MDGLLAGEHVNIGLSLDFDAGEGFLVIPDGTPWSQVEQALEFIREHGFDEVDLDEQHPEAVTLPDGGTAIKVFLYRPGV